MDLLFEQGNTHMKSDKNNIAEFLYKQAIAEEIYPDNPEGESLAILNMLADIRKLGYDYHYFADIKLRKIADPSIMELLLQYYPMMESVITKGEILRKINAKLFPIVFDLALVEYNMQSPLDKSYFSDFQEVLGKSAKSEDQLSVLFELMENPDNYASSYLIRKKLLSSAPERLKKYTFLYYNGVLLPDTLKEFARYADAESIEILENAAEISDDGIQTLCQNQSYKLCVTMQEYWKRCCTKDNIQSTAKKLLKKLNASI
ncbi:MAG: hypothetical protein IKK01_07325 [Clostridia bacterium]|nr:hypothetical protein [Clostridia bacterium]